MNESNDKIKLIALFGESSAGKDSIQDWLITVLKNGHKMISYTSRPMRDYEREGKQYHFITHDNFKELIAQGKMLEYTYFNNWYYGTPENELQPRAFNVGVFNPMGIRFLLQYSDKIDVLPVWIKANDKTRLLRSLNREINPDCEEICRRFLADKYDFSQIDFDYEIYLNDDDKEEYYGILNRPKVKEFLHGQK